jgi:hypothetical protein
VTHSNADYLFSNIKDPNGNSVCVSSRSHRRDGSGPCAADAAGQEVRSGPV